MSWAGYSSLKIFRIIADSYQFLRSGDFDEGKERGKWSIQCFCLGFSYALRGNWTWWMQETFCWSLWWWEWCNLRQQFSGCRRLILELRGMVQSSIDARHPVSLQWWTTTFWGGPRRTPGRICPSFESPRSKESYLRQPLDSASNSLEHRYIQSRYQEQ